MSRRRYISTDISVDQRINALTDFAALLYTWMVAHADDHGTITGNPVELIWTVVPGRKKSPRQIVESLEQMFCTGLVVQNNGRLYFPHESFYRYQTYIPPAKRRNYDPEVQERRETPENTASPSLSPSPIKHMFNLNQAFDSFWSSYPRRQAKIAARKAFDKAAKAVGVDAILDGIKRQTVYLAAKDREYIPLPATWLNQGRWADEIEDETGKPLRVFSPAEESSIAAALEVYRTGDYAAAQEMVSDELWCEVMRRGKA